MNLKQRKELEKAFDIIVELKFEQEEKQGNLENSSLRASLSGLMRNYVLFVLRQQNLSAENLRKATGIKQELLEDFLDQMIDEGKVDLKEGIYFLKE